MKRRGRKLTAEERSLWREVAKTTERRRFASLAHPPEAKPEPPTLETPEAVRAPLAMRLEGRLNAGVSLPETPRSAPSGLDKRTEARLRKGKRDPDARIDLHGMTAQRAHLALIRFIEESRRNGLRMVLVITGKGAPGAERGFGDPAPGVLRREAPVWLSTPPLAGMIVNVSQAHPRHGGGGALYVYLKKTR